MDLRKSFRNCVNTGIDDFIQNYHISYNYNKEGDADDIIRSFLQYLKGLNLEHKIYIIVDEYDNFTNAILEGNTEHFKRLIGDVKAFYANIKITSIRLKCCSNNKKVI